MSNIITLTTLTSIPIHEMWVILRTFFERDCGFYGRTMSDFPHKQEGNNVWKLYCPGKDEYDEIKRYNRIPNTGFLPMMGSHPHDCNHLSSRKDKPFYNPFLYTCPS